MRRLFIAFFLCSAALAQPAPNLRLSGILKNPKHHLAIITAPQMAQIVSKGQALGPYNVTDISDAAVELSQGKQKWKLSQPASTTTVLALPEQALTPATPDDALDFWSDNLDMVDALTLLAAGMDLNVWITPDVKTQVNIKVNQASTKGLLNNLAEQANLKLSEEAGFLLANSSSSSPENLIIPGEEGIKGQAQVNFVRAPLHLVMAVLAREAGMSFILPSQLNTPVTIITQQLAPVKQLFHIVCQGQSSTVEASASDGILIIANKLPIIEAPVEAGPLFSYQPQNVWIATPVRDVLQAMAKKMQLKLVLPPGFNPKVYLNLEQIPALVAAEHLLALQGYHCRVDNGQLLVDLR